MRRLLGTAAVSLLLTACASTPPKPPTPAELLVAAPWNCQSTIGPGTIKSVQTYKSDGTAAVTLDVKGGSGGMTVDAAGNGDAKWQLLEADTKLQVTLGNLTVTRANLNGQNIDPKLAQSMIGSYLAGQSATSGVVITSTTLELTAEDAKTSCTRPEPAPARR
jgi:outer membrane biogenesis lipoprotein LolB